jgi:hypothetical protein
MTPISGGHSKENGLLSSPDGRCMRRRPPWLGPRRDVTGARDPLTDTLDQVDAGGRAVGLRPPRQLPRTAGTSTARSVCRSKYATYRSSLVWVGGWRRIVRTRPLRQSCTATSTWTTASSCRAHQRGWPRSSTGSSPSARRPRPLAGLLGPEWATRLRCQSHKNGRRLPALRPAARWLIGTRR